MADIEQEHWNKTLEEFSKKSNEVYNKLITWAEKSGSRQESIKRDLKTLADNINKPYYQKWDFWKTVIFIVLYIVGIVLIITKGGCFAIKGLIELGTCKII